MRYVIAYDITDDGRRTQVAKLLLDWGRRIQKSVFECELSAEELREVSTRLQGLLETSEDLCHIFRLCAECAQKGVVLGSEVEPAWADVMVA